MLLLLRALGQAAGKCFAAAIAREKAETHQRKERLQTHIYPGRGLNTALQTSCRAVQLVFSTLLHLAPSRPFRFRLNHEQLDYVRYVSCLLHLDVEARSSMSPLPVLGPVRKDFVRQEAVARLTERARCVLSPAFPPAHALAAVALWTCLHAAFGARLVSVAALTQLLPTQPFMDMMAQGRHWHHQGTLPAIRHGLHRQHAARGQLHPRAVR